MDRIEIHLTVPHVNPLMCIGQMPTSSASWSGRVETTTKHLEADPPDLQDDVEAVLIKAVAAMGVSMRAVNGIRGIARTIAAFEGANTVSKAHVAEAIRLGDQGRRAVIS